MLILQSYLKLNKKGWLIIYIKIIVTLNIINIYQTGVFIASLIFSQDIKKLLIFKLNNAHLSYLRPNKDLHVSHYWL